MPMRGKTAILAVALMILCAVVIGGVTAQPPEESKDKVIHVSGTGKVTTTPDLAIIVLAVETENANAKVAQQQNAQKMDAVVSAIKDAGIPAKDIKTSGYSIIPVTEKNDKPLTITKTKYYRVVNTLEIRLSDIDRAGEIIDLAVVSGANRVDWLSLTLSDAKQQEFRSEALTAAVKQARGDADVVVAALGKAIIDVKEVNVGGSYAPMRYDSYNVAMEMAGGAPTPTPIEVGEIDVTASVSITYIIA